MVTSFKSDITYFLNVLNVDILRATMAQNMNCKKLRKNNNNHNKRKANIINTIN